MLKCSISVQRIKKFCCFFFFQTDVEISLVGGSCKSPVEKFWHGSSAMYILQKAVSVHGRC